MKHKQIIVPLYNVEINFFNTNTYQNILEWVKKQKCYLDEDTIDKLSNRYSRAISGSIRRDGESISYFMWVRSFRSTPDDWNSASHELIHIKNFIWEEIGLKDQVPTGVDEVEAHLFGHLMEEFVRFARS